LGNRSLLCDPRGADSKHKMNTIKTVSIELIEKINSIHASIKKTYVTGLQDIRVYMKNFVQIVDGNYDGKVILNYPYRNINILDFNNKMHSGFSISSLVGIKEILSTIGSYCPCNSNKFQDTGGCTGKIDCPTHTQSVCHAHSGCNPYSWCNKDACTCNGVSVCVCNNLCSYNVCPCDCFGYIV
jgi:hypothetical protein